MCFVDRDVQQLHNFFLDQKISNVCQLTQMIQLHIFMIMMIFVVEKLTEFQNDFIIEYMIEYN